MQQIADWLKKLGMSEYAERFVENRIDISVLPDLTEQHLKDLGIALGERLKLLRAIRDLGSASVAAAAPSAPADTDGKMTPSVASSPSCSPTSSARPRSPSSTLRTCGL